MGQETVREYDRLAVECLHSNHEGNAFSRFIAIKAIVFALLAIAWAIADYEGH